MIRSEASPGTRTVIVWLTKSVHGHSKSWAFESLRLPRAGETYNSFLWWLGKLRLLIRKGKISFQLKLFRSLDIIVRVWWLEFLTSFFSLLSESCVLINHQQVLGHTLIDPFPYLPLELGTQWVPGSNGLSSHQLLLGEVWWQSHRTCDTVRTKENRCFTLKRAARFFRRLLPLLQPSRLCLRRSTTLPCWDILGSNDSLSCCSHQLPFVTVTEALWAAFVRSVLHKIYAAFSYSSLNLTKVSGKMKKKKRMMPMTWVLFLSTSHGGKMLKCGGIIFLGGHYAVNR